MTRVAASLVTCVSVLFAASAFASGLEAEDLAKAKALTQAYAVAMEAGDAAALAALYAEDAILLPPNAPMMQGRAGASRRTSRRRRRSAT
jgi:hypothetical protein